MQTTTTLSHAGHSTSVKTWIGRGLLAAVLATTTGAVFLNVVNGPQLRAAAATAQANEIASENRAFCKALGVGSDTPRFAECGTALMDIRNRHAERTALPTY